MSYTIEIVDTYDRDFLTYEIWKENIQIAEVYREDEKIHLDFFTKYEKIQLDFECFLNTMQEIENELQQRVEK